MDAIGFPLRGLSPEQAAGCLAEWVRWPAERGTKRDVSRDGRSLALFVLDVGGGAELRTVVETKKRLFLPPDEILCFYPSFRPTARRVFDVRSVETRDCPFEPVLLVFPDRLHVRLLNPFDFSPREAGPATIALVMFANRVEFAPEGTRPGILPTAIVVQDPEVSRDEFTAVGRVEEIADFDNTSTRVRCRRFRLATPSGPLDVVAAAADVVGPVAAGTLASAEGELAGVAS